MKEYFGNYIYLELDKKNKCMSIRTDRDTNKKSERQMGKKVLIQYFT